jgi:DNA-binding transcriptional LysR family regulator
MSDPATGRAAAPFTLRQVECFIAVAESGTITAAAELLRASDSAVADSLSAMERTLGVTLFHRRRSRGATLTSDGLAILPIAHRMLAEAEELSAAVGRDPSVVLGPVRVGAIATLAPLLLPRLILEMNERYPAVRVEYRSADQPSLISAMARAELDCMITFDIDVPPELHRRRLLHSQARVIVSEQHPLAGASSVSLDQLAAEPMILLDIESSRIHTLELMSSRGVTPRIAHRTDNYELCRSLVGRGLGYSLLMSRDLSARTWDGSRVVALPIDPAPRDVAVLIMWQTATPSPRLGAFIATSTELFTGRAMGGSTLQSG